MVLHEVHVEIECQAGKNVFSWETLRSVVEACREKPDLFLFDYGFSSENNANLPPTEYFKHTLTPAHLISALRAYLEKAHPHDSKLAALMESALIANTCPLYLYTFTGAEFHGAPPIPDERKKLTQRAF